MLKDKISTSFHTLHILTNWRDVSKSLIVREHVSTQLVDDGLDLIVSNLPYQRTQAMRNTYTRGRVSGRGQCVCCHTHHLTARFWTSPFLSSTRRRTLCTTFRSLSSSSLMESFCSSVIKSFVAMKRKSLSTEDIYRAHRVMIRGSAWRHVGNGRKGIL